MAIFKKLAAAAAVVSVAFSLFSGAADAAKPLRVGSLTVYPPFEYLDSKTGQYEGFDMDLISASPRRRRWFRSVSAEISGSTDSFRRS